MFKPIFGVEVRLFTSSAAIAQSTDDPKLEVSDPAAFGQKLGSSPFLFGMHFNTSRGENSTQILSFQLT